MKIRQLKEITQHLNYIEIKNDYEKHNGDNYQYIITKGVTDSNYRRFEVITDTGITKLVDKVVFSAYDPNTAEYYYKKEEILETGRCGKILRVLKIVR